MNPEEAVRSHIDLGANRSIGMHHATFQLSDEAIDAPARALAAARARFAVGQDRFSTLQCGETMVLQRRHALTKVEEDLRMTSGDLSERKRDARARSKEQRAALSIGGTDKAVTPAARTEGVRNWAADRALAARRRPAIGLCRRPWRDRPWCPRCAFPRWRRSDSLSGSDRSYYPPGSRLVSCVPAGSLSAGLQTISTGATRPLRKRGLDRNFSRARSTCSPSPMPPSWHARLLPTARQPGMKAFCRSASTFTRAGAGLLLPERGLRLNHSAAQSSVRRHASCFLPLT